MQRLARSRDPSAPPGSSWILLQIQWLSHRSGIQWRSQLAIPAGDPNWRSQLAIRREPGRLQPKAGRTAWGRASLVWRPGFDASASHERLQLRVHPSQVRQNCLSPDASGGAGEGEESDPLRVDRRVRHVRVRLMAAGPHRRACWGNTHPVEAEW